MGKSTILLLADAGDPAAWSRARRARAALSSGRGDERQRVLLRDLADMEALFPRLADSGDVAAVGVRHVLVTQQRLFLSHFDIGEIRLFSAPSDALRAFLEEVLAAHGAEMGVEEGGDPGSDEGIEKEGRDGVWVAIHEASTPATKTAEAIARACAEEGHRTEIWETGMIRARVLMEDDDASFAAETGAVIGREIARRIEAGGIGTILGLDLNWYLDPGLFLDHPRIRRVVSFWFDDVKAWCQAPYNACFPGAAARLPEALRHPKVLHCCYGRGQLEEMRLLGFANTRLSFLAAPAEALRRREWPSPETKGKAAFVGNPGLNVPPPPALLALLERGAEIEEIRSLAREIALLFARSHFAALVAREPSVLAFFAHALELRAREPYIPAAVVFRALEAHFPAVLAALNHSGEILNALLVVKMANQFDRPALVHRLWRAGLLDVHSNADAWRAYGIEARPDVPFHRLGEVYQNYLCHLNGSNACRDATANEKLFEIAAYGRVSVNFASPDVLRCYGEGEIAAIASLGEAEARVRGFLADPDTALAFGERARRRTASEHLWNHRLRGLLT
ncbi:glycosyltransferase [Verrucomicrobium sp. GAS474]|uniref:glycosyltransferase n=1 Tax=Verrucomicrobium sp. GAS474 TaxID=1882831 RepID=UPI0012FF8FFE|nr:glycosyltransferase [Verrucomicrobium sp. GAS474]